MGVALYKVEFEFEVSRLLHHLGKNDGELSSILLVLLQVEMKGVVESKAKFEQVKGKASFEVFELEQLP